MWSQSSRTGRVLAQGPRGTQGVSKRLPWGLALSAAGTGLPDACDLRVRSCGGTDHPDSAEEQKPPLTGSCFHTLRELGWGEGTQLRSRVRAATRRAVSCLQNALLPACWALG